MEGLPRFANRGLIEAPDSFAVSVAANHFPDSRIGASLKQINPLLSENPVRHFPDSRIGASLKPARPAKRVADSEATSPIRESGPH